MSQSQGPSSLKRKRPVSNSGSQSLSREEQVIYEVIRGREGNAIWARDLKQEVKQLTDREINKFAKTLLAKGLIKEVVNIQSKGRRPYYIAAEFEPSKELTGGVWYTNGSLDTELINVLQQSCIMAVNNFKVATVEGVMNFLNARQVYKDGLQKQQVEEILRALVLDDKIMEVKSNGMGEFGAISVGKVCYKSVRKAVREDKPVLGAMASIPCGVCPRISICSPDGLINPNSCEYYTKWFEMQF